MKENWQGKPLCEWVTLSVSGSSRAVLISYSLLASDSILMLLLLFSSFTVIKTHLLWPCTMEWRPTALQVPFRSSAQLLGCWGLQSCNGNNYKVLSFFSMHTAIIVQLLSHNCEGQGNNAIYYMQSFFPFCENPE